MTELRSEQTTRSQTANQISEPISQADQISLVQNSTNSIKFTESLMSKPRQHAKKQSHASKALQIPRAHKMQKLAENDESVFLAVVRATNDYVSRTRTSKGGKKRK